MISASLLLAQSLALSGGHVVSLVPGSEAAVATILIEGDRITAIGPDLEPPPGCEIVDCTGLWLAPGLIDGCAFHDPAHDVLYTLHGVTVLRDQGNELGRILQQRERVVRDTRSGPLLSVCGAALDGHPPSTSEALVLESVEDADASVARLIEEGGVDFLSAQSGLDPEVRDRVIRIGHAAGLQVWSRLPVGTEPERVAALDGILFLDGLLPADQTWPRVSPDAFDGIVARLARSGTRVTPVLSVLATRLDGIDEEAWFDVLGPDYEALWRADFEQQSKLDTPEWRADGQRVLARQRELVRRLYEAGVRIVPGSGSPFPRLPPGAGLVRELRELVAAGIPAPEVLALATREAARALDLDEDHGTLEPGKLADVVALAGDPRADPGLYDRPRLVVLRGRLLEREDLDSLRQSLANDVARLREVLARSLSLPPPRKPDGDLLVDGSSEVEGPGGRISAERWSIVRTPNERLVFCSRARTAEGTEVELRQTVAKTTLESFELSLNDGERVFEVRGELVAGHMRIQRRLDGRAIDVQDAPDEIAAVDVGSAATDMLLAHTRGEGDFQVLRFHEGLELELAEWRLSLGEHGEHTFLTPRGPRIATFRRDGVLETSLQQQGNTITRTRVGEVAVQFGGLPLPSEKAALLGAAPAGTGSGGKGDATDSGEGAKGARERSGGGDGESPSARGGGSQARRGPRLAADPGSGYSRRAP